MERGEKEVGREKRKGWEEERKGWGEERERIELFGSFYLLKRCGYYGEKRGF